MPMLAIMAKRPSACQLNLLDFSAELPDVRTFQPFMSSANEG